jgi:hypothetical protein
MQNIGKELNIHLVIERIDYYRDFQIKENGQ